MSEKTISERKPHFDDMSDLKKFKSRKAALRQRLSAMSVKVVPPKLEDGDLPLTVVDEPLQIKVEGPSPAAVEIPP
ncbi:hypothetical protein A2U01_0057158, partial [Trifolium medium]|nr:hypothetical protein [Trifolium medium]